MINDLDLILEMYRDGEMKFPLVVSWVVKRLALDGGTQADFENLPEWLRDAVVADTLRFEKERVWYIIGANSPGEDYAPYAHHVRKEILVPLGLLPPSDNVPMKSEGW